MEVETKENKINSDLKLSESFLIQLILHSS